MLDTALALLPIFLLIVLGFWMKRSDFVPEAFWAPAEKTTYFITFPALLVFSTANAPLEGVAWGPLALTSMGAVFCVFILTVLTRRAMGVSAATFTSVVQGSIRPNTYVGLAAAAALFGDPGVALTALCVAGVVPLVNVLAVATLVRYVGDGSGDPGGAARATLKGIITNPLILACALGITLNATGLGLPPLSPPSWRSWAAPPCPLACSLSAPVLRWIPCAPSGGAVLTASTFKLVVAPAFAGLLALALGLTEIPAVIGVLYAALPCSASSYVLARRMGGDAPCMASIITFQTLAAAATLPLVIAAAGWVFGVSP